MSSNQPYAGNVGFTKPIKTIHSRVRDKGANGHTHTRAKLAEIRLGLALRKTDLQIANELRLTPHRYNTLKKELIQQSTADLYNTTPEELYIEYSWQQSKCISDLEEVIKIGIEAGSLTAATSAIKAKSDILDKIIKMGQDIGVLVKEPEKKFVIHGHAVATMEINELRKLVSSEVSSLATVVAKYGDQDMMGDAPEGALTVMGGADIFARAEKQSPKFTGTGKSGKAKGGLVKAMAAKVRAERTRVKSRMGVDSSEAPV